MEEHWRRLFLDQGAPLRPRLPPLAAATADTLDRSDGTQQATFSGRLLQEEMLSFHDLGLDERVLVRQPLQWLIHRQTVQFRHLLGRQMASMLSRCLGCMRQDSALHYGRAIGIEHKMCLCAGKPACPGLDEPHASAADGHPCHSRRQKRSNPVLHWIWQGVPSIASCTINPHLWMNLTSAWHTHMSEQTADNVALMTAPQLWLLLADAGHTCSRCSAWPSSVRSRSTRD